MLAAAHKYNLNNKTHIIEQYRTKQISFSPNSVYEHTTFIFSLFLFYTVYISIHKIVSSIEIDLNTLI